MPTASRGPKGFKIGGQAVLKQVAEYLRLNGLTPERRNAGVMTDASGHRVFVGEPGTPDVSAVIETGPHRGKRLWIECKATRELPTPLQLDWILRANARGEIAFWTDSVDRVVEILPHIIRGARICYTSASRAVIVAPGAPDPEGTLTLWPHASKEDWPTRTPRRSSTEEAGSSDSPAPSRRRTRSGGTGKEPQP